LCEFAKQNNCRRIRLDVINTNPAARRLYEREGFAAVKIAKFAFLEKLLGFSSSATMIKEIR
jgi:ribosomal protein S18 acetylase RimI-like enzyme